MRVKLGLLENSYCGSPTKKYPWPSINRIQDSIKDAILKAVDLANLQGRDRIIIPRALLKSAEFSARLLFGTSISDLTSKEWMILVENTLPHINPEDMKTKRFLEYFLFYLS